VPALESKIDDLYGGPLDEFTAARNALAKTLSGDEAARVRKLAKPTVVPWAVNLLYWRARPVYDRLLARGARLRKTQIDTLEGRRADLRAAAEAHRTAIGDAVKEAARLASTHGAHPAADALTRTIEALSLRSEAPDPPGRLTEPLEPAGFEALAGVPVHETPRESTRESAASARHRESAAPPALSKSGQAARRSADAEKHDREEVRRREAGARAHAAAVAKAEAALARARSAATLAHEAAERADKSVAEAETELRRLRSEQPL
jgi:hypothetical protein